MCNEEIATNVDKALLMSRVAIWMEYIGILFDFVSLIKMRHASLKQVE